MEIVPAITLGSSGANGNFAPAFVVPASMSLYGYKVDGPNAGAPWYRQIDLRGPLVGAWPRSYYDLMVPATKVAAVRAVLDAENLRYQPVYGGWPWATLATTRGWKSVRLHLAHPGRVPQGANQTPWTSARLTTLLASLHTAITT